MLKVITNDDRNDEEKLTFKVIVGQIGAGHSVDEILSDYSYLEREDIFQALRYAAWRSEEREIMLTKA